MTNLPYLFSSTRINADRGGLVLAAFALLLAPLGLLADKAVVLLALAAALIGGIVAGRDALPWRSLDRGVTLAISVFLGWCLVTTIWSFHPLAAAGLAIRLLGLLLAILYLAALAQRLQEGERRLVRLAFCAGFAITVLLLVVELTFGAPILTLLRGTADSDYAIYSRLNRGVSALAVLVWPLALLAWQRGACLLACALPPAMLALTLGAQSSASVLALAAGVGASVLASLGRRLAQVVLILSVVFVLFGSPFIPWFAQQAGLAETGLLHDTAKYRLHVWNVVSDRIALRPVFGWGFDASPDLPTDDFRPFREGAPVIPSHPHNAGLQIAVETGLVGSLLAMGLLMVVARRIDRLEPAPRAAAVAMVVTVLGIAATAYSIWQSHWLAMIGAAAAMFVAIQPTKMRH